MKYIIRYDSNTTNNNDGDKKSKDPYSYRGTTSTSHSVNEVITKEVPRHNYSSYETEYCDFELKHGELYYLVYAVYSTGDSFGHDSGSCIEFIMLYEKEDDAWDLYRQLEKSDNADMKVTLPSGKYFDYYIPWLGYFESLCNLTVLEVIYKEN